MAELPIVVETYPWLSVSFGALIILVGLALGRAVVASLRAGDVTPAIMISGGAALFALGLGLSLALRDIHWQFRLDENGVALRAPFDYVVPSGAIAWADLTSVHVSYGGSRGTSYKLHFIGRDGTHITLANADGLPVRFDRLLQALVAERAPQVKDAREIAGELIGARANSGPSISNGYWVRYGSGERPR